MTSVAIRLMALEEDELEEFIELWCVGSGSGYVSVERIGKANDKGCDVIGFLSQAKHEGPWHLYQCKRKTRGSALWGPLATDSRWILGTAPATLPGRCPCDAAGYA